MTSTRRVPSWSARTVISFWVRVPVLSVQITVVEPRVSTAGSRRTRTRMPAIRCIPRARVMVVTASSPSGTAAMASEMPDLQHVQERVAAKPTRQDDHEAERQDDTDQQATELGQLPLERRVPVVRPLDQRRRSFRPRCACRWR